MSKLINKSITVIKYEGIIPFIKKSYNYLKKKLMNKKEISRDNACFKDILFINGCTLPHPSRYRVDHQIEQLHFLGYSCDSVFYEDLNLDMVKYYRGFIFFRCPHTDTVENFIKRAKYFNKKTFFDIDDLVIDEKYVKDIKYLKTMSKEEYSLYLDGVNRMKKTLELCDLAITTTSRLANELRKFGKEVFINRNVASEKMVELSEKVKRSKLNNEIKKNDIVIGYFSGSITHNDDFNMIAPLLKEVLETYKNVKLKIVGILDVPDDFKKFGQQIIVEKFMDWKELPKVIGSVDINIAPLEETIFNEAKSENKWIEAALVKVPTIASNIGAFKEMIKHDETGILCSNSEEWRYYLKKLIEDEEYRKKIGENAYKYVLKNCVTAYTGYNLYDFIEKNLNENILFILPSTQISGGVNVVIKHCNILRKSGCDVTIYNADNSSENIVNSDGEINVINSHKTSLHAYFSKGVATLWTTVEILNHYPKVKEKYYLVQNFETDFYPFGHIFRNRANLTYNAFNNLKYITISKWCQKWLLEKYKKESNYAPNGIDLEKFVFKERDFTGKIRILIEGNSEDFYKNVDESFQIANLLDRDIFEIWYLSYKGKPKSWYKIDKFLHKIPYDEVGKVYQQCHILLKSSLLESFSYPPLEMMATGGIAIVAPNEGNVEYLKDRVNCLFYKQGDVQDAINKIIEICNNKSLREKIIKEGLKTANERSWEKLNNEIIKLYEVKLHE